VTLEARVRATLGPLRLDVALTAGPGPLVLAGPSGAGKTRLLLLLLGVLRPAEGRVVLGGRTLLDTAAGVDVPTEARGLGYVPQEAGLFPHLTALGNVAFAVSCRHPRLPTPEQRARALALLAQVGLASHAEARPAQLSGGERQRVALARALASEPQALLLDEPLSALDVDTRRQVRDFLARLLAETGLPALVVSHEPRDVAALGARVVVLEKGRVVQQGTAAELRAAPATPFVQAFAEGLEGR
jgi:ABC-type sulfate/molybdate transport systems ATPase subunit